MSALDSIPALPPSVTRSDSDVHSSASSGQTWNRDGSPAQSTSFLQTAKNLVSQRTNINICFNCEAPHTEFCHFVAKADPAYGAMVKKGVITFGALGDYRNAVVLCGSCHNHFDRTSNCGWIFLPTKMEWFIMWERENYDKRLDIFGKTGTLVERTYPDEEDYERYMRESGQLRDPVDGLIRGGLYYSYILEEMFPPVMMKALKERGMKVPGILPGGPKRWHGAPMAAINRGFVVTGASEMKLPRKEWEQLRTLQRLYSRKYRQHQNKKLCLTIAAEINQHQAAAAAKLNFRPKILQTQIKLKGETRTCEGEIYKMEMRLKINRGRVEHLRDKVQILNLSMDVGSVLACIAVVARTTARTTARMRACMKNHGVLVRSPRAIRKHSYTVAVSTAVC